MNSLADVLHFSQKEKEYNPKVHDLLASCLIFLNSSCMLSDGALSKYDSSDVEMLTEIYEQIGNDIYNTWKDSCSALPEPELIIMSLLQLATKIAYNNDFVLSSAEDIADDLHFSLIDLDTENGSNEQESSKTCKPHIFTNEEMRDLLKD